MVRKVIEIFSGISVILLCLFFISFSYVDTEKNILTFVEKMDCATVYQITKEQRTRLRQSYGIDYFMENANSGSIYFCFVNHISETQFMAVYAPNMTAEDVFNEMTNPYQTEWNPQNGTDGEIIYTNSRGYIAIQNLKKNWYFVKEKQQN